MRTTMWWPVLGAAAYEVSDQGEVRSITRMIDSSRGRQRLLVGKVMKPALEKGYLRVTLVHDDGRRRTRPIHQLVCEAAHGPKPDLKSEVRHLNGVRTDNRPENLAWGSKQENAFDSVEHGTNQFTRRTHCDCGREYDLIRRSYRPNGSGWLRGCSTCRRKSNNAYAARRRRRSESPETLLHGDVNTYTNDGCRCRLCRDAHAARARENRRKHAVQRQDGATP